MPFVANELVIQRDRIVNILDALAHRRTVSYDTVRRSKIILLANEGKSNSFIAETLGVSRNVVSKWRNRFIISAPLLYAVADKSPADLYQTVKDFLADQHRSGRKRSYTMEQNLKILEVACRDPKECGVERSHWTHASLADYCNAQGITDSVSAKTVGRYLKDGDIRPHLIRYWLYSAEKIESPETFARAIAKSYGGAPMLGVAHTSAFTRVFVRLLTKIFFTRYCKSASIMLWYKLVINEEGGEDMSRRTKPLICSKSDIISLQALAADTSNPRVALRAQMVLECAKGRMIKDVAAMFSERPNTVIKWKDRYEEQGIGGLTNAPRGNTKDIYGEPFSRRLRELLETDPPNGEAYWTGPLLAEALGTPHDTIRRYLRRENIHLLEYRRRVKETEPPSEREDTHRDDRDGSSSGEISDASPGEHCDHADVGNKDHDNDDIMCISGGDIESNTAISLETSQIMTCEKRIAISIRGFRDTRKPTDPSLDMCVSLRIMDGESCIKENLFSLTGILPNCTYFDVKINDTS